MVAVVISHKLLVELVELAAVEMAQIQEGRLQMELLIQVAAAAAAVVQHQVEMVLMAALVLSSSNIPMHTQFLIQAVV